MDEKSDQIIEHIEAQRNQLGANLNELETRVRQTTDWRTHFDNNPMLMLGAALGGGVLLGAMVGGNKSPKSGRANWSDSRYYGSSSAYTGAAAAGGASGVMSSSPPKQSSPVVQQQKQHASETVDMIKAALIGFAMAKAKEFLGQALPGFDHHLEQTERQHTARHANAPAAETGNTGKWGGDSGNNRSGSPETVGAEPVTVGTPS